MFGICLPNYYICNRNEKKIKQVNINLTIFKEMNKKLFFLAIAALGLAACSNDDVVEINQSNAISFRPLMNNVTRATSLALSNLESDGFYVTATYTSGHTAYFADQLFKQNSTTWEPYSNGDFITIYWPNKEQNILDFHAYAPNNSQLVVSNTYVTTLNGCPEYTVTPNAAAASQVDFLYATLPGQDYGNAGTMTLAFAHKESQISINLKNTSSGLKFTVSEVAVCNIPASGIFKNRNGSPSTATTMGWGNYGSNTSYLQTIATPIVQNGIVDAAPAGTSWILIPHTLAAPAEAGKYSTATAGSSYAGAYIRVKMKVQSTANTSVYYAGNAESYVSAIWPISGSWAEGYHYTYTIDLSGGGYLETNKDEGDNTDQELDRVLDLTEITFAEVTVANWTTSSSIVGM